MTFLRITDRKIKIDIFFSILGYIFSTNRKLVGGLLLCGVGVVIMSFAGTEEPYLGSDST